VNRVVVLGPAGAGKTEFAVRLSQATGIPVVHLDPIFWRPGWQPAPRDEARSALTAAVAAKRWIVDGNFLGEDDRFRLADAVFFLDLPRLLCISRILARWMRDRGRRRPDLPDGCAEGFDLSLIRWVWGYRRTDRPRVLGLLAELGDDVEVHHLRTRAEVAAIVRRNG